MMEKKGGGSENDFWSNRKHFTATGSGNLWRGGLHTRTMDMQVLCDYSVKRYQSAKSTTNSTQQSPMTETDELHTQNDLPPKKTLRHTAVVEASNHNAKES
jgi:hypothetical protein